MAQTTPDASSSQNSDSSNATQYMPNTGMHMDQVSWPQHPYIPYLVYAPAHPYYPYGVPPPWTHSAPSPHAPDAPSSGVGAGVPHHTSQAGQDGYCPSPVADVSGANPPPKHPSAPPLYQPSPSGNLGSPPPSVPQTPNSSVGRKRVGEDVQERDAKRTKTACGKMEDDPLFVSFSFHLVRSHSHILGQKPVLNRLGLPNGTFVCSKDGMVLNPESYLKHIKTKMHLGYKLEKFKCPVCSRTCVSQLSKYANLLINILL